MRKSVRVPIKELKLNLFVRQALDQGHALYLAELVKNGVALPPIEITVDLTVIDGRHRIEAHELNNLAEIDAVVVDVADESELIALAYKANVGGSLPPTQEDTEHTVALLLDRGEAKKHIGEMLGLPAGMARRYINDVQSKVARAKLLRAAAAVTDGGLTVAKAAEQYEVDLDKLKGVLSGNRQKHKMGVAEIQRELTKKYKGASSKNAALFRGLLEKLEDGDVTANQVLAIFTHVESLQKRAARAVGAWRSRFEATARSK